MLSFMSRPKKDKKIEWAESERLSVCAGEMQGWRIAMEDTKILEYQLTGEEDFLLMGCDGIWELCEDDCQAMVDFVGSLREGRGIKERYELLSWIGRGTYGTVFKARCKQTGQLFALKKYDQKNRKIIEDGFSITSLREIRILMSLQHPNIIELKELYLTKPGRRNNMRGSTILVFEYMEYDLAGIMKSLAGFELAHLKCVMRQILVALEHLHSKGFAHRDLKSANILMNLSGEVKLGDFGLAKQIKERGPHTPKVVTLWYRAPELLFQTDRYTEKVDVWSAGCIFVELYNQKPYFNGEN
ncbi:cyclin-dependent kinase 9-like [Hippocampus zosterae]|uniref:cyclin-dependent kinase 9-like n=1 Tax=Hippocampus zosterae TaxID=109293 RepID=UPI00223E6334|nr:cyclin-dependent kinase 9-like [Hippocampus zosterae]